MKKLDHPEANLLAGLSNPARRALFGAGITSIEQLTRFTEADIKKLHGIGPNALKQLRAALAAQGLAFGRNTKEQSL